MRTAGSSLSYMLKELESHNLIKLIDCGHRPYVKCEQYCESVLKGSWNSGVKVSTVREPYENTISLYVRSNGVKGVGSNLSSLIPNADAELRKKMTKQFQDQIKNNDGRAMCEMRRQGEILFDPSGKIAHDYIVKFETLNQDIVQLLKNLDILDNAKKLKYYNRFVQRANAKSPIDIDEWFDKETKDIVYNIRKREFITFNYPA